KELLAVIIRGQPRLLLSEHVEKDGIAFFKAVVEQGLEGIIAKEATSQYKEGIRSQSWLKLKAHRRQHAVIGGFTKGRGSRKRFGALVLGVYQDDALIYVGHTGTGFTDDSLDVVAARLEPLVQDKCPFAKRPATNAPARWVRPELVCEVEFQDWTEDG